MRTLLLLISALFATHSHAWLQGTVEVRACRSFDDTGESCYWNYRVSTRLCSAKRPCDKLVVFFDGADMRCEKAINPGNNIGRVLTRYAEKGYVAVSACLFKSLSGANALSLRQQGPRVGELLREIRSHAEVRELWSGKDLLLVGHSLGATTPVVTMARTAEDEEPWWRGSRLTAGCFLDGVYDIPAIDRFYYENLKSCRVFRNKSVCARYAGEKDCRFPLPITDELKFDSIADVGGEAFAVGNFRLVECGSKIQRPKCALRGDWVPMEPIRDLCERLASAPGHSCEMASMSHSSHLNCAYEREGIDGCRLWFDRLSRD